jgi:hypothetical protein
MRSSPARVCIDRSFPRTAPTTRRRSSTPSTASSATPTTPTLRLTLTLMRRSAPSAARHLRRCWSAVGCGTWRCSALQLVMEDGLCGADGGAVAAGDVARVCGHSAARRNGGGGGTRVWESIDPFVVAVFPPPPAPRAPLRDRCSACVLASNLPAALLCSPTPWSPSRALCGRVCNCSIARRTASVSRVCTSSPKR